MTMLKRLFIPVLLIALLLTPRIFLDHARAQGEMAVQGRYSVQLRVEQQERALLLLPPTTSPTDTPTLTPTHTPIPATDTPTPLPPTDTPTPVPPTATPTSLPPTHTPHPHPYAYHYALPHACAPQRDADPNLNAHPVANPITHEYSYVYLHLHPYPHTHPLAFTNPYPLAHGHSHSDAFAKLVVFALGVPSLSQDSITLVDVGACGPTSRGRKSS